MIRGERALHIDRPQAAVFDYIADLRNMRHWNSRVARVERLDAGAVTAGSRFRSCHRHAGWLETEIISYQRPARLLLLARGRRLDLLVEFLTEREDTGTALHIRLEVRPHRHWRLLAPFIVPRFRRENPRLLRELKQALETYADTATDANDAARAANQRGGHQ